MHCLHLVSLVTLLTFANILAAPVDPVRPLTLTNIDWNDLSNFCLTSTGVSLGDSKVQQSYPSDCQDILNAGQFLSGQYIAYRCVMKRPIAIPVYCDMTTDGGGWTVFQRRLNGSQQFLRSWTDYRAGFGNLNGEFWLGNDFLSLFTYKQHQQLRFDLEAFDDDTAYAKYANFSVAPSYDKYRLEVLGYSGNAGDSFIYQNGSQFSTVDSENDVSTSLHCAKEYSGAWWFKSCHDSHLNGEYFSGGVPSLSRAGLIWITWKGSGVSLKTSQMMFKPASG